mmetsp:Transcript_23874/g.57602  ORF Transcript_23874/g.57602 Transcript_23874/m.57602 type:complete len:280 (-) Transcript_23874:751-1590(-)
MFAPAFKLTGTIIIPESSSFRGRALGSDAADAPEAASSASSTTTDGLSMRISSSCCVSYSVRSNSSTRFCSLRCTDSETPPRPSAAPPASGSFAPSSPPPSPETTDSLSVGSLLLVDDLRCSLSEWLFRVFCSKIHVSSALRVPCRSDLSETTCSCTASFIRTISSTSCRSALLEISVETCPTCSCSEFTLIPKCSFPSLSACSEVAVSATCESCRSCVSAASALVSIVAPCSASSAKTRSNCAFTSISSALSAISSASLAYFTLKSRASSATGSTSFR